MTGPRIFSVNPASSIPLYAQVVEELSNRILTSDLEPGATLPSVRALAESLNINMLTVQKAYKVLEMNGLVQIRKGVGAFVTDKVSGLTTRQKQRQVQKAIESGTRVGRSLGLTRKEFLELVEVVWNQAD